VGDWIWDPQNGPQLLDDLVPGDGFIANGPAIINNEGQILDQIQSRSFNGYVLLTPTPEPSSVGLCATGIIPFALGARRRRDRSPCASCATVPLGDRVSR
jgi:hypothetical protein